jgi:branched-subunit amino acid ABC-type transport system permease component
MDATTTLDLIEAWMVISILFIAGSVAAFVGALIERFVIRPIGKRRGWYE